MENKLGIVLITYNRKKFLEETFKQIFSENSPIKNLEITVLNNNSTDGTNELINDYCKKFHNIKHVINKINIGGNANIAKAFAEYSTKDYIWVICDNDTYDWSAWKEIKNVITNDYDVIITRSCKNKFSEIFYEAAFAPACIYKTKNITNTVIENVYDNIRFLFPHLAIIAKNINDNNKFFVASKDIVNIGVNPNFSTTFNRDRDINDVPQSRKNMFWSVGFFNSIELINDRKKQIEIINDLRHYHRTLFQYFRTVVIYNQMFAQNSMYNLLQIFRFLNFGQKLKFLLAFLSVKLSSKDYKYWFIRYEEEWMEYLKSIEEDKYIKKIAKKIKNKKVLLYGAGMFYKILAENYDLSEFNIIGISDKKFENSEEKEFNGIKIIKPSEIKTLDCDVILFTMKEYKKIENSLKKTGVEKKFLSLIKSNTKYALRV